MISENRLKLIFNRLKQDYDYLTLVGYEVAGVFLQGSDNYNLSDDKSDIDTKAIIVPSLDDLISGKKVSTTIVLKDNSHLDVKDIRSMYECFLKQNINFLEILFTDYKIINNKYIDLISPLFIFNENIARYDIKKCYNTLLGDLNSKFKSLIHVSPHSELDILNYGYCLKDFHHIFRLDNFISNFLKGISYKNCLTNFNTEQDRLDLIKLKREGICSSLEAVESAKSILNKWEVYLKTEIGKFPADNEREDLKENLWIKEMLDNSKKEIIKRNIQFSFKDIPKENLELLYKK